jgi:hypothetical protein
VNWQHEVYGPMLERTLENAQLHALATRYDLGRDSRLARAIVRTVNDALDRDERRRGVQRVRTGELLIRTGRGPLILPLRTNESLQRVLAGERWDGVRAGILHECQERYRRHYPKANRRQVARFTRTLFPGRMPARPGSGTHPALRPRRERPWGSTIPGATPITEHDLERARQRRQRGPPRPAHDPNTIASLTHFLDTQAGIPAAIQEALIFELISLRARYHPFASTLATGQMPLAAMHTNAGRNLWKSTRDQPLAPILITLLHGSEARTLRSNPPTTGDAFIDLHARRMARVLSEAYVQDGLLSYAELQWIFLTSHATVGRALDAYQRQHNVILPSPGTVLDMGRMLTHKDMIIRLHLQGLSTLEIARQTHHNPKSVDAYLKTFDAVLILHLYRVPRALSATILGHGTSLIDEYHHIMRSYLKDPETMRDHLTARGVNIPAQVLQTG